MKLFKSALLSSAIIATLVPHSISAHLNVEDLVDSVRIARSCPVQKSVVVEKESKGWFSSFREKAGNCLRSVGDSIRGEANTKVAAGKLTEQAKEFTAGVISVKTGVPISSQIFTGLGNMFRTVGQWIKGGEATQTATRVTLDNLDYRNMEHALKTAATVTIKTNAFTAPEAYLDVLNGMNKRGHSFKEFNTQKIFVEAMADELVAQNLGASLESFKEAFMVRVLPVIERSSSTTALSDMEAMVGKLYDEARARNNFNATRKQILAN